MSIEAHLEEPGPAGENRLRAKRKLRLDALESGSGNVMNVVVHELSEAGLLLQTSVQLSVGEELEVVLPYARQAASVVWEINGFVACRFERRTNRVEVGGLRRRSGEQHASAASEKPPTADSEAPRDEAFGTRLKRLRKNKGLSLVGFARLLNVSKPTAWKWETDRVRPRQKMLETLSSVLEVSEQELLYGKAPAASAAPDASSLSELISHCKGQIAELAGISIDKVSITLRD